MSTPNPLNPDLPSLTAAERNIASIAQASRQMAHNNSKTWCGMCDRLWFSTEEGCNPALNLAAYGNSAKAAIEASRALMGAVIPVLTLDAGNYTSAEWLAKIQDRLGRIPAFAEHADGTVTLASP